MSKLCQQESLHRLTGAASCLMAVREGRAALDYGRASVGGIRVLLRWGRWGEGYSDPGGDRDGRTVF